MVAGPVGEALGDLAGDDPPQVDLGRLLGPGDQDGVPGHGDHRRHLEPGRGDRVAATVRRRVSQAGSSAVMTRRPSSQAGTPATMSTQAGSCWAASSVVAPVPGSAARTWVAVWSRAWTSRVRGPPASQLTETR